MSEEPKNNRTPKCPETPKYRTVEIEDLSEEELKGLNTYYFTFRSRQMHEGMYQPIMAKNMSIAYSKMLEMYGTKWASNYNQEEWDDVWKDWGALYEGKNLKTVVVL